jgi:hypothetical protein
VVDQSYYDNKGKSIEDFSLPVYEDCEKILENIGFSVTDENSKEYDSILEIKMSGAALCDYYNDIDTNTKVLLYTGAQVDGSISIRADNEDSIEREFFEVREPPIGTVFKPTIPSDAPFDRLGWQKHLFIVLSDVWGPDILLKSLELEGLGNFTMKKQVIEAMAESQSCPVDVLIDTLKNEGLEYREDIIVIEALGKKGDESAVSILTDVLLSNVSGYVSSSSREAAAKALGRIGSEDGLDALNQALEEDKDEEVQEACREAIDIILDIL